MITPQFLMVQALETEMAKGPISLVKLMKVGRHRALDRIGRMAKKETAISEPGIIRLPNLNGN